MIKRRPSVQKYNYLQSVTYIVCNTAHEQGVRLVRTTCPCTDRQLIQHVDFHVFIYCCCSESTAFEMNPLNGTRTRSHQAVTQKLRTNTDMPSRAQLQQLSVLWTSPTNGKRAESVGRQNTIAGHNESLPADEHTQQSLCTGYNTARYDASSFLLQFTYHIIQGFHKRMVHVFKTSKQ